MSMMGFDHYQEPKTALQAAVREAAEVALLIPVVRGMGGDATIEDMVMAVPVPLWDAIMTALAGEQGITI